MRQLFREVPEACDNTPLDRRAGQRRDRVRQAPAARLPAARGLRRRRRLPPPPHLRGRHASGRATQLPDAVVERLDYELEVIDDMGFSAYFLIVWDLIRYAREHGHPGRARAGGRPPAARRLLPAHHRPRPDQVRPAVRALPQPGPHLDARHRHGLRLPLPRRDDPLRGRAVRPRPRRPDRHVLHHQGPGRGARRRPGARLPVRRRRQGRQGHAAADHGPRHAAATPASRSTTKYEDGYKMAAELRAMYDDRPRRQAGRSTSPRASRACAARTASTPPRW